MVKNISAEKDLSAKAMDVLKKLQEKKVKRLPILQSSGALETLLYLEGIISYLLGLSEAGRVIETHEHKGDFKERDARR
ncbi:MAG TPA: hypothetical protein VGM66_00620 [Candidatus Udaeobacter sp.]